jgi:8-oxo-dGTP pyrophosphatase MutT (NUDIX family)
VDKIAYQIIDSLEKSLSKSKPGSEAHKLMMPEGRILISDHDTLPTPCAVLIALYIKNNTLHFPIIRRPVYNGLHSGQIAFPGGKKDDSDTNLINTAQRECYEEIGIAPDNIKVLGTLSELFIQVTNMHVLPVVGVFNQPPKYKINKHEVDELFSVNINDLFTSENKKIETWEIRGQDVDIPFYYIQEQKVWGATAMILSELEQIIRCI